MVVVSVVREQHFQYLLYVTRNNNNSADPEAFESNSGNWGISAGLNIPS
jgi:hypothetical protein